MTKPRTHPPVNILNLSWGTQSFTLAAMSALGQIMPDGTPLPKLDLALFVDTGHERESTIQLMNDFTPWLTERGLRVVSQRTPNNSPIYPNGHGTPIPAFIPNNNGRRAMMKQRCTVHWKIEIARQIIRRHMRENGIPLISGVIHQWFGITTDEYARMKRSKKHHITHRYPLIELRMTRDDCIAWLKEHNLPIPTKSSCVFCPYQSKRSWSSLRARPADLAHAIAVDEALRNASNNHLLFVHPACKPLANIIEDEADYSNAPDMADVCETGYCWT